MSSVAPDLMEAASASRDGATPGALTVVPEELRPAGTYAPDAPRRAGTVRRRPLPPRSPGRT
ncbi:hypothetical protein [Streptomyces sp. NBC_00140]|uniref:hypothetical protein n=1 Tax=Streptomyces sp. NBC_00140 TaxID=2975664 RepID=UPI002257FA30|nr:hypothetical protein [Streptomyces sp. NBC_00140]MCX5337733.1 hypothetical protein [Streptomyces sp. NBC_00140]